MKKLLVLCLAGCMMFSLVACGNVDDKEREPVAPSEEYTEPIETPDESIPEISMKEIFGVEFQEIPEYENYEAKEFPANIDDNTNIHLFTMNQKEYNLHTITIEDLANDEIKPAGYGNAKVDTNGWYYVGTMYGLPNEDGNRLPPVNPIFLDVDESKTIIEAISCIDDETKNVFYNGLYVGMSEEEAVKLLKGASVSPTNFDHYYFLKNSETILIVKAEDEIIDSITLIKNSSMDNWVRGEMD